jgi:hypothetical protein
VRTLEEMASEMKQKMESLGIPYKNIDVYGGQIIVTVKSRSACTQWNSVIRKIATVRKIVYVNEANKHIDEGRMYPRVTKVYKIFAQIC